MTDREISQVSDLKLEGQREALERLMLLASEIAYAAHRTGHEGSRELNEAYGALREALASVLALQPDHEQLSRESIAREIRETLKVRGFAPGSAVNPADCIAAVARALDAALQPQKDELPEGHVRCSGCGGIMHVHPEFAQTSDWAHHICQPHELMCMRPAPEVRAASVQPPQTSPLSATCEALKPGFEGYCKRRAVVRLALTPADPKEEWASCTGCYCTQHARMVLDGRLYGYDGAPLEQEGEGRMNDQTLPRDGAGEGPVTEPEWSDADVELVIAARILRGRGLEWSTTNEVTRRLAHTEAAGCVALVREAEAYLRESANDAE